MATYVTGRASQITAVTAPVLQRLVRFYVGCRATVTLCLFITAITVKIPARDCSDEDPHATVS